eukprot:COSAG01_NODE_19512_length_1005_cov_2.302428_1_plen_69_part_00
MYSVLDLDLVRARTSTLSAAARVRLLYGHGRGPAGIHGRKFLLLDRDIELFSLMMADVSLLRLHSCTV